MISFGLAFTRRVRAWVASWRDPYFRSTLAMAVVILTSGTLIYGTVEKFTVVDAIYVSVAPLATVGSGDLAPKADTGTLFTVVVVFVGMGLFIALFTQIAQSVIKA